MADRFELTHYDKAEALREEPSFEADIDLGVVLGSHRLEVSPDTGLREWTMTAHRPSCRHAQNKWVLVDPSVVFMHLIGETRLRACRTCGVDVVSAMARAVDIAARMQRVADERAARKRAEAVNRDAAAEASRMRLAAEQDARWAACQIVLDNHPEEFVRAYEDVLPTMRHALWEQQLSGGIIALRLGVAQGGPPERDEERA